MAQAARAARSAASSEGSNVTALQVVKRTQEQRFAECRALGHSWKHRPPIGIDDDVPGLRRPFGLRTGMIGFRSHCTCCGTDRVRWVTRSGETIVRYEHPDGYSRHGDDRLSSSEWRRSFVSSIFEDYLQ